MYNLGVFHAQGRGGLTTNLVKAKQLFVKAANLGQVKAQEALQLEECYKRRSNVPKNNAVHLEPTVANTQNDIIAQLAIYENILSSDMNESPMGSTNYFNSFDETVESFKSPTEMFLEVLGIHERSAISLISVGGDGS